MTIRDRSTSKCSPRAIRPSTQPKRHEAEIAGLNTKPFTQAELKRAKDDIVNSFLFRYDTQRQDPGREREARILRLSAPTISRPTSAALEKVTLADLTAAAKKYIHPEKLAVLVVGNGPEIKPPLDALGMGAPQPIDITIPQPAGPPPQAGAAQQ